jgi:ubiquinone/menaquinone biosynthesis C-methylase UbiE
MHFGMRFCFAFAKVRVDRILQEMDRILRPRGTVIIREDVDLLVKVKSLADGISSRTVK